MYTVFELGCFYLAVRTLIFVQHIILTPTAIIVPKQRFSSQVVIIPFSAIREVSLSQVSGPRDLRIAHEGGTATINSRLLPTEADFEEIRHSLLERVEASKRAEAMSSP